RGWTGRRHEMNRAAVQAAAAAGAEQSGRNLWFRSSRSSGRLRIGGSVAAAITVLSLGGDHVDVGIVAGVLGGTARTDFQQHGLAITAVLDLVAVGDARLEAGAVAGAQQGFALVLDQHHLAVQHPDELVFRAMPVALAGPGPGGQAQQIDAELIQADRVAQPPAATRLAGTGEFFRISRS